LLRYDCQTDETTNALSICLSQQLVNKAVKFQVKIPNGC